MSRANRRNRTRINPNRLSKEQRRRLLANIRREVPPELRTMMEGAFTESYKPMDGDYGNGYHSNADYQSGVVDTAGGTDVETDGGLGKIVRGSIPIQAPEQAGLNPPDGLGEQSGNSDLLANNYGLRDVGPLRKAYRKITGILKGGQSQG